MIHEVLRAFRGEGRDLTPGDYVETSHWRLEKQLIRQKKLGTPQVPQKEYDELMTKVGGLRPYVVEHRIKK